MTIEPPSYSENIEVALDEVSGARVQFIKWYLDCKSWVCACGLTNFGRNKQCAKQSCKKPRPLDLEIDDDWQSHKNGTR